MRSVPTCDPLPLRQTMQVNELKCPHCGSPKVELTHLFESLNALVNQDEIAENRCPECNESYGVERHVAVDFEILSSVSAPIESPS